MPTDREVIDMLLGIIGSASGSNPAGWVNLVPERTPAPLRRKKKVKRAPSARQKQYGRAFKRLSPRYKKKNGSWKKDGFKRCVRAAHRECRRKH
jgi:hypothetical protein